MTRPGEELLRLAATVLQPGFEGTTPPDWVRRLLGEGLGSVALFSRNVESPAQVAALTAALRAERADVLVGIDEEAGDVTRFESRLGSSRPGNLALGAVDDVALTTAVARDLGCELAAAGVNLDYAPDADVNNNPDNPVIGVRSFGADPALVARHTAAWVTGLQEAGVAACAKHFPGHGDTAVDSHHDLPRIVRSRASLDDVELAPFRAAIAAGVQAIMTGHLLVPAVDPELPATLSRPVLTDLLRDELGFQGAVITDGIEMRAIVDRFGFEGAVVRALAAGADAICVGGDNASEETAVRLRAAIASAVTTGALAEERLIEAAKRVEQLAAWPRRSGPSLVYSPTAIGLVAARRALKVTGAAAFPLVSPPHVIELSPPANIAIGTQTPWGLAAPLSELMPGTTSARYDEAAARATGARAAVASASGAPLVVVVRDLHRHPWMRAMVDDLLTDRPDTVVVELGVPALVVGAVHVATHGATRACAAAAAELLAGTRR